MICARPTCTKDALSHSNFCAIHMPRMRSEDEPSRPSRVQLLLVVAIGLALALWILPVFMDWAAADMLRGADSAAIAAKAAPIVVSSAQLQCPRPTDHESLVIFVNSSSNGQVRMDCHLVGARGAYTREKRR